MKDNKENRKEYFAEYQKNNKHVRLTFSNADYEVVDKIATQQGLTLASFIRYAALAQARNIFLFPKEIEDQIKLAIRNMRGIGNNINQISKYANEQRYLSQDGIEVILNHLLTLEKELQKLKTIIDEQKGYSAAKINREITQLKKILPHTDGNDFYVLQYVISNLQQMVAAKKGKKDSAHLLMFKLRALGLL